MHRDSTWKGVLNASFRRNPCWGARAYSGFAEARSPNKKQASSEGRGLDVRPHGASATPATVIDSPMPHTRLPLLHRIDRANIHHPIEAADHSPHEHRLILN